MEILSQNQVWEIFLWYKARYNTITNNSIVRDEEGRPIYESTINDTWILNITLTFTKEARKKLRQQPNGIVRAYHRFLIKVAQQNKCHCFGWIGIEDDLVLEHAHILLLFRWDGIRPTENPLGDLQIKDLWNHGIVDVKIWDGKPFAVFYDYASTRKHNAYGDVDTHYHYVVPTYVYHPRRSSCRNGTCQTCKSFPSPDYFGFNL